MKPKIREFLTTAYMVLISFVVIFLLLAFRNLRESFEEISVKRINVVDQSGHNRLVITNRDLSPEPVVNGKKFKRRIVPAGMVFYDETGSECGGLVLANDAGSQLKGLLFDYSSSEAVGVIAMHDSLGFYKAGIFINDKPVSKAINGNMPTRVLLNTENGNAGLIINDASGKPRIKILVDSLGNPSIALINQKGERVKYMTDKP